ncbi:MAG TPA: DUF6798 domain-containing protein [Planctomycetaceae bacterium]
MIRGRCAAAALVFACFAAVALWRSPVPGVNEPQYLCKAKHFYAPEWCSRDMFLNSANAHWVFYVLAGAVTRIASLDQTAWIGRILVWAGLAHAWVRLTKLLLPGKFSPVWAACLFLALQSAGNLSGEWLIGGVEAKGFAYIALLLAIVAACERSYRLAAVEVGLAISFHPVVGIWGALALMAAVAGRFVGLLFTERLDWSSLPPVRGAIEGGPIRIVDVPKDAGERRTVTLSRLFRSLSIPALLCLVFALPGLIPAIAMIASAPSQGAAHRADIIQVFDRLDHHLDPADFSKASYVMYAVLLAIWLAMSVAGDSTAAQRFFTRFVLATLAITLAGLVAGFGLRDPWLMKFYPFRLFDLFLPIAVSTSAIGLLERVGTATASAGRAVQRMLAAMAGPGLAIVALGAAVLAPGAYPNPSNMQYQQNWLAFVDACRWIEKSTPRDALFLTLRMNVGFKWYAQRAEYVTWKDCPQDASGILEWKDRLDLIVEWRTAYADDGFTEEEFAALAEKTGIEYALAWNTEPWHIEPVYRNRAFSVYRLAK